MITINCASCGQSFQRKPSEINLNGKNYCSSQCSYQGQKGIKRPNMSIPRPNRKTGIYKHCEVCNKEFYVQMSHIDRKFCSLVCKGIASRLPSISCVVCGKEFKPPASNPNQLCCSLECGHVYRRRASVTKQCEQCEKDFIVAKNRANTARFCSKDCANEYAGRNKTVHICKMCNKEFKWSASRSLSGNYNITYCSLTCRDSDPDRHQMLIEMNAKQQRMTPNRIERIGYNLLDSLNIDYQSQYLIGDKFCVDAFIPSRNIVVQFDGDYWHGNLSLFPVLDSRQERRVKLDRSQDAYMRTCGYTVIRIWASDLEKRLDSVKLRLLSLLERD